MNTGRIACLLVPDLPLCAALRADPGLADRPDLEFVVTSGTEGRSQVVAVSPAAAHLGLQVGCSLAHARAVCRSLRVVLASPELERSARQALLDVALSLSPRAVLMQARSGDFAAEAAALADASGVAALFGSEQRFASALGARAETVGLAARVAIASTRSTAHLAARALTHQSQASHTIAVLDCSDETCFLAPLAIDLLDPPDDLAQALTHLGVYHVRDLLRLPRQQLLHRFGPSALELVRRASGNDAEEPLPAPARTGFEESIALEFAIDQLEQLLFALRGALSRLIERLTLRGMALDALEIELLLEGGGRDVRRVAGAAPTRDIRVWLRLVTLALESRPPPAPIEGIAVRTRGCPERSDQLDLFGPSGPDPRALEHTLAALEAWCGTQAVGAPAIANDHRPGAYALQPFALAKARRAEAPPQAAHALVVRALRPPVAAQVRVRGAHPVHLRSAVSSGEILHTAGPWRSTGHWWSQEERYAFDHYDIQTSDGSVLRLCFDWMHDCWFVDAVYD